MHGIHVLTSGARTTIEQNTIIDNEDSGVIVKANYVVIRLNTIDGDTSSAALVINGGSLHPQQTTQLRVVLE